MTHSLDLELLLKLRLIVARHGEMDRAGWWNTDGLLSRKGSILMARGFPKTHYFSQARVVFEVARARSSERFPALPGSITLWSLPASVEDEFDSHWVDWLEATDSWTEFFLSLQEQEDNLLGALRTHNFLDSQHEDQISRMRRSAEERAVALPGKRKVDDETLGLLAAAFSRGEPNKLAVPYAQVGD